MDALTLVDTFGVLSPHAASYFATKVKERVKKPLEIHFHADFGLAVANTIMAVLAGAEVIHSTVAGIGERTGNTPFEETVLALLTLYGIDCGIKYNKLNELSNLVRELSGIPMTPNRPLIGDMAYDIESGIVTSWYKNVYHERPTDLFPVNPAFVGHRPPKILLGKKSGLDNVHLWASRLDIELNEKELQDTVMAVKTKAIALKRPLTEAEFEAIVTAIKAKK